MMNAHSMPFSRLIDIDQGAKEHYHVPKYQREYTWNRRQWDQLLLDIEENDSGYFMGSIICIKDGNPPSPGDEVIFEVVDGQQRLTTLSLLIMAIYHRVKEAEATLTFEDDNEKDEFSLAINSLRNKLVKRKRDGKPNEAGAIKDGKSTCFCRVQPSSQNHNLDDYKFLLGSLGLLPPMPKPANCGNRLMVKAYRHFLDRLSTKVASLLAMVSKLNQLTFVHISVATQSDAFILFETLNNRGVPLSAIDIIKNKMLSEMEKKHSANVDDSYDRWQQVIEWIPDASDQERFLRHFYHAFKIDPELRVEGVSRAVRSKIIYIYEQLIKKDAPGSFARLVSAGETYGHLLQANGPWSEKVNENLLELSRIGAAPAYQLLLYIFHLPKQSLAGPKVLDEVTDLVCRYYLRRNITDTPPTRELDAAHIEDVEECVAAIQKDGALTSQAFANVLLSGRGAPAGIEAFRNALLGDIYANNINMARYLLCKLDSTHHTREYSPDLWARDDRDKFVWTIEHVLPQTENLSKEWQQMLANGDKTLAAEVQARCVNRFGNLTLSGYNSTLSARPLAKKQELAKDKSVLGHKINIGYRNGLALNQLEFVADGDAVNLATTKTWNEAVIDARTNAMVNKIVELYRLPGEK